MHRVNHRRAGGFSMIEMMVAVTILAILLATGIPTMSKWMSASRATGTAEFYAEGLRMARSEALKRNVASRMVLSENANGQYDWRVDICVPSPDALCRNDSGSWSTVTTALTGAGVSDFFSVQRSASNLPKSTLMALSFAPDGADEVYFTPVGWVDGSIAPSLNRITIAPAAGREGDFPTSAVALTLAGMVTKCNPTIVATAAATDSRNCP